MFSFACDSKLEELLVCDHHLWKSAWEGDIYSQRSCSGRHRYCKWVVAKRREARGSTRKSDGTIVRCPVNRQSACSVSLCSLTQLRVGGDGTTPGSPGWAHLTQTVAFWWSLLGLQSSSRACSPARRKIIAWEMESSRQEIFDKGY